MKKDISGRRFEIVKEYLEQGVNLPQRKTSMSAGYDLESAINVEIPPGKLILVPTGLKVYMEANEVLSVHIRSSLAIREGLVLANGTGIIDGDYVDNPSNEGHIKLAIYNRSAEPVFIRKGQAIAQGIFHKYLLTVNDTSEAKRFGGFGSTDDS